MEIGMKITKNDISNLALLLQKIKIEGFSKEELAWLKNFESRLVEKLNDTRD